MSDGAIQELLRPLVPKVLGALIRRYGGFEACEDAVQDALLAAAIQWHGQGVPDDPQGWLLTVASRRLADQYRSDVARRRREATVASLGPSDQFWEPSPDADRGPDQDDTLTLLFLCCHPALDAQAQAALTLRAVGGLSTEQIARAFLTSEAAMARRIGRAKHRIKASGIPFELPPEAAQSGRLRIVLHVLYLIFNEGYATTSGPDLRRPDLTGEAIRLTRESPLLLVLDEPTAALDPEAEHALFERYAEQAQRVGSVTGAITILVSHRFSTVRMADLIVVIADGRLTAAGDHASLVAAGGLYSELYGIQADAYR